MPYHNQKYNRRRRYKKKSQYSKYGGYLDTASKALAVAYSVKKLINVEKKTFDTNLNLSPGTSGSVTSLSNIIQGDDYNQREGRSIKAISLESSLMLTQNASANNTLCRVMFLIDNDLPDSGTLPAVTDILVDSTVNALRNPDPVMMKRFTIVRDYRFTMSNDSPNDNIQRHFYKKMQHHIKFSGTAAADSAQGTILVLALSDQGTNIPSLSINNRVRYVDN